ncbi:MAG: F0F1 ATP synthase subunit B [Candidatus Paceibacterota bacterium]
MEALEIDWKIFVGQLINFAILFFLLKVFVYGPFLAMIKKRREKIQEGVEKSIEAEEKLKKLLETKQKMEADNESQKKEILFSANEEAKKRIALGIEEAEKERQNILLKAEKEAQEKKAKEAEKTKKETIENAFFLAENLLKQNIDDEKNKKITDEFLSRLKL